MRILFSPDPAYTQNNAYFPQLCNAITALGEEVGGLSPKSVLALKKPDIVHVHFPEFPLTDPDIQEARRRLRNQDIVLKVAKLRGAKLIWTAHNLRPHERRHPELEKEFYEKWLKQPDGITVLTETAKKLLLEAYPLLSNTPIEVIPHGHYRDILQRKHNDYTAKIEWGFEPGTFVLGSLGMVRPYKNVPLLIQAFREVAKEYERLLIAGKCPEDQLRQEIEELAKEDARISLKFDFLTDEQLESATFACDLLAAPYSDITNSGSVFYTLSCDRPFLAPRMGSLPEVEQEVGSEWVKLYDPPFAAELLRQTMDDVRNNAHAQSPDLSAYNWTRIAEQTCQFYRKIKRY